MRFLLLIFTSILLGCGDKGNHKKKSKEIIDTTIFVLDKTWKLDIVENKTKNYTAIILRDSTSISSLIGSGNTFPIKKNNEVCLDTILLNGGSMKAYLMRTYVNGSTYGAEVNYIIYQSSVYWELFQIPFDQSEIKFDTLNKELYVIKCLNGINVAEYKFSNGILIKM